MAQLNFYVPEEIERVIRWEARNRRKSISTYLSEVVKSHVRHERWQKDFFTKVVGGWRGKFPVAEDLAPEERIDFLEAL